jgi:hypothetical protein
MLPLAPLSSNPSNHAQATYENRILSLACFLYEGDWAGHWASLEEFMRLLDPTLLDDNALLRHFNAGATFHRTLTDCSYKRKPLCSQLLQLVQPIRSMTTLLSDVATLLSTGPTHQKQLDDLGIYMGNFFNQQVEERSSTCYLLEYGLDYLIKPQFERLITNKSTNELIAGQPEAKERFMQSTFECCFLLVRLASPAAAKAAATTTEATGDNWQRNHDTQQKNRCLQFLIEFCLHFGFCEQAFVAMMAVHPDRHEDDAQSKGDAARCFVHAALKVQEASPLLLALIRLPWQGAWAAAFEREIRKRMLIEPSNSPDGARLYNLLYAFYVHRDNVGKAALYKYLQASRLQQEDDSADSLRKQMQSYLAALSAMQLEEATSTSDLEGVIWLDMESTSDPSASPKRELDSDVPRVNSKPNGMKQKLSVQHLRQHYLLAKARCKIVEATGRVPETAPPRRSIYSPMLTRVSSEGLDEERAIRRGSEPRERPYDQEQSITRMESAAVQLVRHGQFPLAIQLGLQLRTSCVQPFPGVRDDAVHGFGCDLRYLFREYARTQASQHVSGPIHPFPTADYMQLDASARAAAEKAAAEKHLTDDIAAWQLLEEYLHRLDGPHTNFGLHEAVAKEILAVEGFALKSGNRRLPPWIVKSWLRAAKKQDRRHETSDGSQEAFGYSAGFNRLIATLISFNCGDQVVELFAALLREERTNDNPQHLYLFPSTLNDNSQHLYLFPSTLQCVRNLLKDAKTKPTVAEDAEYLETQLGSTLQAIVTTCHH